MNKKRKNILIIISFVILLLIGYLIHSNILRHREYWITDMEHLYDVAINYVKNEELKDGHDKNKDNYQVFVDYKGFGITVDEQYTYVYIWILMESFYTENGIVVASEGSSMAYRFTVKDNIIIKYELPKDGSEYMSSVKKMFPYDISNKILKFEMTDTKLNIEKDNYYSSLISDKDKELTNIYNNDLTKNYEDIRLLNNYNIDFAIKDNCLVIGAMVHNDYLYNEFMNNYKSKIDSFIRIVQNKDNNLIIYDIMYDSKINKLSLIISNKNKEIEIFKYDYIAEYEYNNHLYLVIYNGELNDSTFKSDNAFVITVIN